MSNWKKYIKIGSGIIIVIAVIWLGFYFWQKLNLTETLFGLKEAPKETAFSDLTALTEIPIFDYWVNKKTNEINYLTEQGEIIKINSDKSQELLNSQTINKLNSIAPSFDGTYIVAKFNYPSAISFSIFNTAANNWQPLPSNILSVAWSPNNSELLYLNNKELGILNLTSQKSRKIIDMTQKDINLAWPMTSNAYLTTIPSIDMPATLWSVNLANKTIIPLIENENGLMVKWSPDAEIGIKLRNQNRVPTTSLIDKNGTTLATLTFTTLPSKCAIESNKIYCAVPKNIPEGTRIPDDYFKKAAYFNDGLYLIDLNSGSTKVLLENNEITIDAEHLELYGDQLLFKNRIDGKLYGLKLE